MAENKEIELQQFMKAKFGIIGNSKLIKDAIGLVIQAAPTDLTVLITGETGTGKEIFANAIHGLSKRKQLPFVSINCGAIPETLLESELFGHEKGAFTSANELRKGFFEVAHKGTIFLDEIGEIPLSTQVKLLRILENGEYSRLGSSKVHKVDVRIIAATNRILEEEVQVGNFRQDLFFRLNSVPIHLPALREHTVDILLLFNHFALKLSKKNSAKYTGVSEDAIEILKVQPWNGNVREFKNFIETMMTLEKQSYYDIDVIRKYIRPVLPAANLNPLQAHDSLVHIKDEQAHNDELGIIYKTLLELKNDIYGIKHALSHISKQVQNIKDNQAEIIYKTEQGANSQEDIISQLDEMRIEELEKSIITQTLKRFVGNRRMTARSLGISERTLYRKIIQYNIEKKKH